MCVCSFGLIQMSGRLGWLGWWCVFMCMWKKVPGDEEGEGEEGEDRE